MTSRRQSGSSIKLLDLAEQLAEVDVCLCETLQRAGNLLKSTREHVDVKRPWEDEVFFDAAEAARKERYRVGGLLIHQAVKLRAFERAELTPLRLLIQEMHRRGEHSSIPRKCWRWLVEHRAAWPPVANLFAEEWLDPTFLSCCQFVARFLQGEHALQMTVDRDGQPARSKKKPHGPCATADQVKERVVFINKVGRMHEGGKSLRAIATELEVGYGSVQRANKRYEESRLRGPGHSADSHPEFRANIERRSPGQAEALKKHRRAED